MLKNLIKDIFNQKWIYLLLVVLIISQLWIISLPYFWKIFIDFIVAKNLSSEFYFYIYIWLLVSFIAIILQALWEYIKKWIITQFEIEKNIFYFKKFFSLDFEYRNQEWTGKTITKINRWIESQISLFNSFFELIIIFFVRIIFLCYVIFFLFKPLIALVIFMGVIIFFINRYISKSLKILTDEEQNITEKIWRQSNKMIMESNLINVSNKTQFEIEIMYNIYRYLPKLRQKIFIKNDIVNNILYIFFQFLEFWLYIILWFFVISNQMTLWEMIMIIAYVWWLWFPIEIVIKNISEYRNQISKYEALEIFVNQKNKIKDWISDFVLKSWEIIFDKINFWYTEERQMFNDFNLKIEGWKTYALVWHSWSWKSTLIKLILRNYLLNSWKIKIDWQDLADIKISTFYENIGYLSQEPAVFDWSIRENLEYGMPSPLTPLPKVDGNLEIPFPLGGVKWEQENFIWKALKNVDLYDLIKNSKDWLETEIWEKWLKLSGWEKQRLALARIFLKNPKILILDEPTSALDSISENKVTQIITEMMKNKTVIVIAHRLQTVMNADKIIVLEKWKIIETWNHSELLEKKSVYASLVDLQRWVINE